MIVDTLNHRIRKVDLTRPAITSPAPGAVFSRGFPLPVTFGWTAVPGATEYGFEHTGPGRQFANPNGTAAGPVNGFGGAGGAFMVSRTSLTVTLGRSTPPGTYRVRVVGFSPTEQILGLFSDAVAVVLL